MTKWKKKENRRTRKKSAPRISRKKDPDKAYQDLLERVTKLESSARESGLKKRKADRLFDGVYKALRLSHPIDKIIEMIEKILDALG